MTLLGVLFGYINLSKPILMFIIIMLIIVVVYLFIGNNTDN